MSVPLMIGARYSRSRSGNRFLSLVSLVSFFGLVLGVIALVVVISVMNGFDRELKHRLLGSAAHVSIPAVSIEETRDLIDPATVVSITPYQQARALITNRRGSRLMEVSGLLPDDAGYLGSELDGIEIDQDPSLAETGAAIILGEAAARQLGLLPGDRIRMVVPRLSEQGDTLRPRLVSATLTGTFTAGSEIEYSLALMDIKVTGKATGEKPGVKLKLHDPFDAPLIAARLREQGASASDWTERFGDFFDAVYMEKIMMFVLLSFVIAVASFSIVSGLSMMVDSKRRDIAVLRTMGMSEQGVLKVFLVQGLIIAVTGIMVGVLLGVPLAYQAPAIMDLLYQVSGLSIVEGTYFNRIPTDVRWLDVAAIVLVGFVISFMAMVYPSLKAARLDPAEILRYE